MVPVEFAPPAPAALNRRVAVRRPCRPGTSARVAASRGLLARSALLVNLSQTGLALRLRRRVKRGSRLLIEMTNADLGLAYDLAARVVHSTQLPAGQWLIGCAFARELTAAELHTLL
jgi:hypothetical protein